MAEALKSSRDGQTKELHPAPFRMGPVPVRGLGLAGRSGRKRKDGQRALSLSQSLRRGGQRGQQMREREVGQLH